MSREKIFSDLLEKAKTGKDGKKDLSLTAVQLTKEDLEAIKTVLLETKTLETLNLSKNDIVDDLAEILAQGLECNKSLKLLNLSIAKINANGAKALAEALEKNRSLETLFLSGNNVGDEGCEAFGAAIASNIPLQELDLSTNNIGPRGAKALAEALKTNINIKELNLSDNQIGDEGAKHIAEALKHNKSLKCLNLFRNNIETAGAKALDEAILENPSIVMCRYENQSSPVSKELVIRQYRIELLIVKWKNTKDRSTFTEYELSEFYTNQDAIKCLNKYEIAYKIDFAEFEKEIHALVYSKWGIINVLNANLTKDVNRNILAFLVRIPKPMRCNESVQSLKDTIARVQANTISANDGRKKLETENYELNLHIGILKEKIESLNNDNYEQTLEIAEQSNKINILNTLIQKNNSDINNLQTTNNKLLAENLTKQHQITQLETEHQKALRQKDTELSEKQEKLQKYENLLTAIQVVSGFTASMLVLAKIASTYNLTPQVKIGLSIASLALCAVAASKCSSYNAK